MFGTILLAGARARGGEHDIAHGVRILVRDDQMTRLRARLDGGPTDVESTRIHGLRNAVELDLGDVRLAARCYQPLDGVPIWQLVDITWHSYLGWELDVNGPGGHRRITAWSLDLTPAA
jgi:hypothetical protein